MEKIGIANNTQYIIATQTVMLVSGTNITVVNFTQHLVTIH